MDVNIFVQVGFVVLVGLAAKNAILIVEFARDRQQEGAIAVRRGRGGRPGAAAADPDDVVRLHPRRVSAGDRPGAGAEMRRTLGTAVFAGMIGVTLFGIFLTPVFFYVIRRTSGPRVPPCSRTTKLIRPKTTDRRCRARLHLYERTPFRGRIFRPNIFFLCKGTQG